MSFHPKTFLEKSLHVGSEDLLPDIVFLIRYKNRTRVLAHKNIP